MAVESVSEFYQGKIIRVIVGYSPGGGYDRYTRLIVKHMSNYIPGKPGMIVDNMTGAGSLVSANYLYRVAKNDGLTLAVFNSSLALQKSIGNPKISFNPRELSWIGAPSRNHSVCFIMASTGLSTLAEVINSNRELRFGATRLGSGNHSSTVPVFLNLATGSRLKIVSGYKGSSRIRLALQQQEIQGTCASWESYRSTAQNMLSAQGKKRLIPFVADTAARVLDPEIANLPDLRSLMKRGGMETMYDLWRLPQSFSRPMSAPPGLPSARLLALRRAFSLTLQDQAFLSEALAAKLIIDQVAGDAIEMMLQKMYAVPQKDRQRLLAIIQQSSR